MFAGVGPRALSNGLNSAVFFCFFEAIRGGLVAAGEKEEKERREAAAGGRRGERGAAAAKEAKEAVRRSGSRKDKEAAQPGLRISLPRLQLLGGARAKPAQLG